MLWIKILNANIKNGDLTRSSYIPSESRLDKLYLIYSRYPRLYFIIISISIFLLCCTNEFSTHLPV